MTGMRVRPSLLLAVGCALAARSSPCRRRRSGSTRRPRPPGDAGTVADLLPAAGGRAGRPKRPPARGRTGCAVGAQRASRFSDRPGGPAPGSLGTTTEFGSRTGARRRRPQRGDWLGVVTSARPNGRLAWVGGEPAARRCAHALLAARRPLARRSRCAARPQVVHRMTRRDRPSRLGHADRPLRGHRQARRLALRPLLRLLHPRALRQPAQHAAGLEGGNRLAIHGTDAAGHDRHARPRPAACARRRRPRAADAKVPARHARLHPPLASRFRYPGWVPVPNPRRSQMVGILLTVLVAVVVFIILAALTDHAGRRRRSDSRADRRHPNAEASE